MGQTVKISVDELRAGVTCSHPVVGDGNVLLLGANTRITTQLLTGLRERGIEEIEVDPRDLAMLRGTKNKKKRTRTRHKKDTDDWERLKPVKDMLVDRYEESIDSERKQKVAQTISKTRSLFGDIARKLAAYEELTSVAAFKAMSDEFARSMVDDHDQTVGHVNGPEDVSDHRERSIRMAVLGMAIAVELGLDGYQTLDVGVAGMLHDVGLLLMDPLYRSPTARLSDADRWEYQKHPGLSVRCLDDMLEVSKSVTITIAQVHEQFDGSGYPQGLRGHRIHLYARILNVADAYLRLTEPTALRGPVVPHDALGTMLYHASNGLFDPKVVRAFLNTQTLYPLGSQIELSSGQTASVVRRPRQGFWYPVLIDQDGNRIELGESRLEVIRPVCDENKNQIRVSRDDLESETLHPSRLVA